MGCRLARAYISSIMGDLPSVLITLPMDMKNLPCCQPIICEKRTHEMLGLSYPNVAPEPSMYWPSVLIGPFGPAPYLMMLNPPDHELAVI